MMGYILVTSACLVCKRLFSYNPHHVPSFRVHGEREPICRPCIDKINSDRVALGNEPVPIHAAAYEPLPEHEL